MKKLIFVFLSVCAALGMFSVTVSAEKKPVQIEGWEQSFWQYPGNAALTEGGTGVETTGNAAWVQSGNGALHVWCEKSIANLNSQAVQTVAALEEGKSYRLTGKIYISSSSWGFGLYLGDTRLTMLRDIAEMGKWCDIDYTFTFSHASRDLKLQVAQKGDLYADDLSLKEVGKDTELLKNGGFEAEFAPAGEVSGLTVQAYSQTVELNWGLPDNVIPDKIAVYIDGVLAEEISPSLRSFVADGLENGKEYTFTVKTKTKKGIYSDGVSIKATPVKKLSKPAVIKDDKENRIVGLTADMEYSGDGVKWTRYDGGEPPQFNGNVKIYVRMYSDETGVAAPAAVLYFTENAEQAQDIKTDAELIENEYTLRGYLPQKKAVRVTMTATKKDADRRDFGAIIAIGQTVSDDSGYFEISAKLADTRNGKNNDGRYIVRVDSDITDETTAPELVFVNSADRAKAFDALFNEDIYTLFEKGSDRYDAYVSMGFPLDDYNTLNIDKQQTVNIFLSALNNAETKPDRETAVRLFVQALAASRLERADENGVYAILQEYDKILGLKCGSDVWAEIAEKEQGFVGTICKYMAGKKYADYSAVENAFAGGCGLAKINAATYGTIGEYIKAYSQALGISGEYYDIYKNYSDKSSKRTLADKTIVLEKSKKEFESGKDVVSAIEKAVAAAENQSGGGGGSSGGGSGTKSGADNNFPFKSDRSGDKTEAFGDMSGFSWAAEAAEYLNKFGIISGTGNGCFEPERNITRAEFAVMLVKAFGFKSEGQRTYFDDVSEGEWYADSVSAAANAGIVSGVGEGRFAPNNNISRQDMAVMIVRCLSLSGGSDAEGFTDIDEVSGYAREAVIIMKESGIVSGYSDGSFGPHRNASRAEAAQILYRVLTGSFAKESKDI